MKTRTNLWLLSAVISLTLAATSQVQAKPDTHKQSKVDRLITVVLIARDDDDREDAAEDLGDIGGPRALKALDYVAVNDDDRGVRKDARKAAKQIRERLLAQGFTVDANYNLVAYRPVVVRQAPVVVVRRAPVVVVRQAPVVVRRVPVVVRYTPVVIRPRVITVPHRRPARTVMVDYNHRGRRGHARGGNAHHRPVRHSGRSILSGLGLSFRLSF